MMQFKKKCVLDIDLKNLIFKVVFLQQMYSAVFELWQKSRDFLNGVSLRNNNGIQLQ